MDREKVIKVGSVALIILLILVIVFLSIFCGYLYVTITEKTVHKKIWYEQAETSIKYLPKNTSVLENNWNFSIEIWTSDSMASSKITTDDISEMTLKNGNFEFFVSRDIVRNKENVAFEIKDVKIYYQRYEGRWYYYEYVIDGWYYRAGYTVPIIVKSYDPADEAATIIALRRIIESALRNYNP